MKILFVCWANIGRSQMAKGFYNEFTGTDDASSAGTDVDVPGETLGERRVRTGGTYVIQVMQKEEGIDISDFPRTQLTEEMLKGYDYIISMAQKEYTPDWLSGHPKYLYWAIADPGGKEYAHTQVAKEAIKKRVKEFISGFVESVD